jgi:hypothetical protein
VVRYEAVGYGSISRNDLKDGICRLIELAEWFQELPVEVELDDFKVSSGEKVMYCSEWIQDQLERIEDSMSGKEKRRRFEMFQLIDELTIGNLDVIDRLDATENICEYERELVCHKGKNYSKFVKWKDKTRLKDLLSMAGLKKI